MQRENIQGQPSIHDIQQFIKSYLPHGLHGVDENGNLLSKEGAMKG
jgi:hypothetical protein